MCLYECVCAVYVVVHANVEHSLVIPLNMQSGVVKQRVFHFHLAGLTSERGEMSEKSEMMSLR